MPQEFACSAILTFRSSAAGVIAFHGIGRPRVRTRSVSWLMQAREGKDSGRHRVATLLFSQRLFKNLA
jgi:hypothetical protein